MGKITLVVNSKINCFVNMEFIDTYRHKGLRRELVAVLKAKGITNENVLAAIERIPRHLFLERILCFTKHMHTKTELTI